MEPTDAVLAWLDRIGALDRSGAAPGELLAELRGLLHEAEDWTRAGATTRHGTADGAAKTLQKRRGRWSGACALRLNGT